MTKKRCVNHWGGTTVQPSIEREREKIEREERKREERGESEREERVQSFERGRNWERDDRCRY